MLRLKISSAFKKDLQLAENRKKDIMLLEQPIAILRNKNYLATEYKDHPLYGSWKGHREFHLQSDWIVIYRIENDDTLLLVRTGTHSDLLKK